MDEWMKLTRFNQLVLKAVGHCIFFLTNRPKNYLQRLHVQPWQAGSLCWQQGWQGWHWHTRQHVWLHLTTQWCTLQATTSHTVCEALGGAVCLHRGVGRAQPVEQTVQCCTLRSASLRVENILPSLSANIHVWHASEDNHFSGFWRSVHHIIRYWYMVWYDAHIMHIQSTTVIFICRDKGTSMAFNNCTAGQV